MLLSRSGKPGAHFSRIWNWTGESPFVHDAGIPGTGDRLHMLRLGTREKDPQNDWRISGLVSEVVRNYETEVITIPLRHEGTRISNLSAGLSDVPIDIKETLHVTEDFVMSLLSNGWVDHGNNFSPARRK